MNLTQREKTYLLMGAAIVGLAVVWLAVLNPLRLAWQAQSTRLAVARRGYDETRTQIQRKKELDASLAAIEKSMGVRVPTAPRDAQIGNLVKEVEATGGKSGIKFKNLTPRADAAGPDAQPSKAGSKVSFRVSFETTAPSMIRFLTDLQAMTIPLVVESLDVRSGAGQADKVAVTLEFCTFIFGS